MVIGHDIPFAIDDETRAQTAPTEFALRVVATKKPLEKFLEWITLAKRTREGQTWHGAPLSLHYLSGAHIDHRRLEVLGHIGKIGDLDQRDPGGGCFRPERCVPCA